MSIPKRSTTPYLGVRCFFEMACRLLELFMIILDGPWRLFAALFPGHNLWRSTRGIAGNIGEGIVIVRVELILLFLLPRETSFTSLLCNGFD